jgi:hypothetical protein
MWTYAELTEGGSEVFLVKDYYSVLLAKTASREQSKKRQQWGG